MTFASGSTWMTEVKYTEKAIDHLESLEPYVADRILNKIDEATEWTEHRIEPLSGYPYYKLRAGDYRAIIAWDREADVLRVEAVGHRRNIYDRHLPP
jgi:mRNA interferase RelE/StbE